LHPVLRKHSLAQAFPAAAEPELPFASAPDRRKRRIAVVHFPPRQSSENPGRPAAYRERRIFFDRFPPRQTSNFIRRCAGSTIQNHPSSSRPPKATTRPSSSRPFAAAAGFPKRGSCAPPSLQPYRGPPPAAAAPDASSADPRKKYRFRQDAMPHRG